MGSNAFVKQTRLTVLGAALLALGCQQQTTPLNLTVVSDDVGMSQSERLPSAGVTAGCYVNPDFQPNEDQSDGFVVKILADTGGAIVSIFSPIGAMTERGLQYFSGDKPGAALKLLDDKSSADNRRDGMNRMAEFGFLNSRAFKAKCRFMAQYDSDPLVRATAIRTENRARDSQASGIFVAGLKDPNAPIRLESAKALANVPDVNAADPLVSLLNNSEESRDIRVASADALKHYRTLTVVRALSGVLEDKNFVIAWQARLSLRYLTDRDYGYDSGAWLAYFTGPQSPVR